MKLSKNYILSFFFILGLTCSNQLFAQVKTSSDSEPLTQDIEFTVEDIEKIKTLIEHHFKTRISDSEMVMYGKASEENLALYKLINETRKEDPFFSQPHISFIIESMEDRLGKRRPQSKSKLNTQTKELRNPKVSKLPKHKSDNF